MNNTWIRHICDNIVPYSKVESDGNESYLFCDPFPVSFFLLTCSLSADFQHQNTIAGNFQIQRMHIKVSKISKYIKLARSFGELVVTGDAWTGMSSCM
jgi:hypothetical protein